MHSALISTGKANMGKCWYFCKSTFQKLNSGKALNNLVRPWNMISCCLFRFCCMWREIFLVPKEMLLVPKVYSPIPNCLLHVINNDTGEELDMVFNKLATHVYQPNKVCGCYQALHFELSCTWYIFLFSNFWILEYSQFSYTMINRSTLGMLPAWYND